MKTNLNINHCRILCLALILAAFTVAQIKAQSDSEFQIADNLRNLEKLAGLTAVSLTYQAPGIDLEETVTYLPDRSGHLVARKANRPAEVETPQYTMQETSLINAGYYKITSNTDWRRSRRTAGSRQSRKYMASEF